MKKTKEEPLQIEVRTIFVDKDFNVSSSMDFRKADIEKFKKMDIKLFESIWEQQKMNGIAGVLRQFPKNWKSYDQYAKKFEKIMMAKSKEWDRRIKKKKKQMTKAEWKKGIPVFQSSLKEVDVRTIIVGGRCWTRLFIAKDLTFKIFQKIINDYKI